MAICVWRGDRFSTMGRARGREITEADLEEILGERSSSQKSKVIGAAAPKGLSQKLEKTRDIASVQKLELRKNRAISPQSPQSSVIDVSSVEVISEPHSGFERYPLTPTELEAKAQLEAQVREAFAIAGKALKELRDRRLYRATHRTFEAYCRDRFKFSRISAHYKIGAAEVYENLRDNLLTISEQIPLPTHESQVRDLIKANLKAQDQVRVWQEAVEQAGGNIPSGRLVKQIVREMFPPTDFPDIRVNDVCQLLVKDNPELTGKNKCWGVVFEVLETVCWVACWDGQYQVPKENLQPFEYSPAEQKSMAKLEQRLRSFQNGAVVVEAASYSILQQLGKLERPFLTVLEEGLLGFLEEEYGIVT
ncbi:hypothetical protein [Merismopedia glauca]|uniref:Uncharacterized protein n=1 Tax=Merismopedia glauca CCAP 1448/3 TaxID=1296344 RepID=A0A2T1BZT7_9CYAN|nr:hypothetical protein [Merismopedia glauca]PSB01540.1 hypothetical protein C7B64_17725 [Merismopedia glauca CCAP 1448/3]